jgi:hypothetical protein
MGYKIDFISNSTETIGYKCVKMKCHILSYTTDKI